MRSLKLTDEVVRCTPVMLNFKKINWFVIWRRMAGGGYIQQNREESENTDLRVPITA